jgi:hypothetical protein
MVSNSGAQRDRGCQRRGGDQTREGRAYGTNPWPFDDAARTMGRRMYRVISGRRRAAPCVQPQYLLFFHRSDTAMMDFILCIVRTKGSCVRKLLYPSIGDP